MKKVINEQAGTITFTFDGLESVVFDSNKPSEAVRSYAMLHGFQARIGDNAAISRKDAGGTVTEAMRREAVIELVDHYHSGAEKWTTGTGQRAAPQNATILAIAAKRGCTYAEAEAWIAEKMLAEMGE